MKSGRCSRRAIRALEEIRDKTDNAMARVAAAKAIEGMLTTSAEETRGIGVKPSPGHMNLRQCNWPQPSFSRCSSSGSRAMLMAIRCASSAVSTFACRAFDSVPRPQRYASACPVASRTI
jgi:hypothetical protein